jgi:hypothetical protein
MPSLPLKRCDLAQFGASPGPMHDSGRLRARRNRPNGAGQGRIGCAALAHGGGLGARPRRIRLSQHNRLRTALA